MDALLEEQITSYLHDLSELINTGHWAQALLLARANTSREGFDSHVHVLHQKALIELLQGSFEAANLVWHTAKKCPGYSTLQEGDFLRDRAIWHIKRSHLADAAEDLRLVRNCHTTDGNRLACATAIEARLALQKGEYARAYRLTREADTMWATLGNAATRQWVTNNLLPMLVTATMAKEPLAVRSAIFRRLAASERNGRRRNIAVMVLLLGQPATKKALILMSRL